MRIFLLLFFAVSLPTYALTEQSGDLESYLTAIDYGNTGDNSWVQPDDSKISAFKQVFDDFINGRYDAAHSNGTVIGYEVIQYTDTGTGGNETHYILRDTTSSGGGTYVLREAGYNAVLQVPHPKFDTNTAQQGIKTYRSVRFRLLMLPGTRRDNTTATMSSCTDGSYYASDVAHQTRSLFHVAHEVVSDADTATIFIQLHGFGSSSLATLQEQCGSSNDSLINMSEGVDYITAETENSLLHILRRKVASGDVIDACVYGNDTGTLGGTWNVQGRYANRSSDSCYNNATVSSKRFVHIEQSYTVRADHDVEMAEYFDQALSEYFSITSPSQQPGTLLGVYYGNQGWAMEDVAALETWQGRKNAVITLFTNFNAAQQENLMVRQLPAIWNHGNIPLISWEPYLETATTPESIETDIANGNYDAYLESWVNDLKIFLGGPDQVLNTGDDRRVYLRLAHEMNGNWYPWSATNVDESTQNYIAMWRHVHDMFTASGLDQSHVQWIWSVNASDHNSYARIAEHYYPGDDYVDWLGVDGYNFGALYSYTSWRTPENIFGNMLSRLRLIADKPIAINETAAQSESGSLITEKDRWIGQLFDYISANNIRMVSWFNADKEADWAIFGGEYGNTVTQSGDHAYSTYQSAVQSDSIIGPENGNVRLLGQAEFEGNVIASLDSDNDGIEDETDNCPETANADQADMDGDGIGNVCDPDIDGDGTANGEDIFPYDSGTRNTQALSLITYFGFEGIDLITLAGQDSDGDGFNDLLEVQWAASGHCNPNIAESAIEEAERRMPATVINITPLSFTLSATQTIEATATSYADDDVLALVIFECDGGTNCGSTFTGLTEGTDYCAFKNPDGVSASGSATFLGEQAYDITYSYDIDLSDSGSACYNIIDDTNDVVVRFYQYSRADYEAGKKGISALIGDRDATHYDDLLRRISVPVDPAP